jgi:hypothetical protein
MDAGIMVYLATKCHGGVSEERVSLEVWQPLRLTLFQASSSSLIQGTIIYMSHSVVGVQTMDMRRISTST